MDVKSLTTLTAAAATGLTGALLLQGHLSSAGKKKEKARKRRSKKRKNQVMRARNPNLPTHSAYLPEVLEVKKLLAHLTQGSSPVQQQRNRSRRGGGGREYKNKSALLQDLFVVFTAAQQALKQQSIPGASPSQNELMFSTALHLGRWDLALAYSAAMTNSSHTCKYVVLRPLMEKVSMYNGSFPLSRLKWQTLQVESCYTVLRSVKTSRDEVTTTLQKDLNTPTPIQHVTVVKRHGAVIEMPSISSPGVQFVGIFVGGRVLMTAVSQRRDLGCKQTETVIMIVQTEADGSEEWRGSYTFAQEPYQRHSQSAPLVHLNCQIMIKLRHANPLE
jgi:hypothetical protein